MILTHIVKVTILSDYWILSVDEGERGRKRVRQGEKERDGGGEGEVSGRGGVGDPNWGRCE